jgi:hypothetical protein
VGTCLHFQVKTFVGRREKGVRQLFSCVRQNEGVLLNQPVKAGCDKQAVFLQPPAFQAGCRGFVTQALAPRNLLWRENQATGASFVLPAASQVVPTFSLRPVQVRPYHLLLESPLQTCAGRPRRGWFTCHGMRAHVASRAMGNRSASARSAGVVPALTHDRPCLPPFSRPLSRCSLLSSHLPLLRLWCIDGTSSAQWTSTVLSLHRHGTGRRNERRLDSIQPPSPGKNSWKWRPSPH